MPNSLKIALAAFQQERACAGCPSASLTQPSRHRVSASRHLSRISRWITRLRSQNLIAAPGAPAR